MSGGGMACSYGAGTLLALRQKYDFKNPDIIIAGSGGAGTAAYFVSGQYDSIKNIWSNLLSTKKFINLFRFWRVIDIDYLIDEVFKKQDILDKEKVFNSSINFLVPLTNAETGRVKYFSNRSKINIFEVMRATKALPILFNKSIRIQGKHYCDSYMATSLRHNALKAIELGADKLIIVDNEAHNVLKYTIFKILAVTKRGEFRDNYSRYLKEMASIEFPSNVQVIFLEPKKRLKVTTLNNNQKMLKETIQQGFRETTRNRALKKLLEG